MARAYILLLLLTTLIASGCVPAIPHWRYDAKLILDRARLDGADKTLPTEYANAIEVLDKGEALLLENDIEEADTYFQLAFSKGQILLERVAIERKRHEEEQKSKAEAERRELEHLQAVQEEQRKLLQKKALIAAAKAEAEAETRKKIERSRQVRERPLPAYHTVKRGETLPQIASQSDVYNDPTLWPLLYRANRDQISDPRHIWPGQVLRIPRTVSRDDMAEARRYAQEKMLH